MKFRTKILLCMVWILALALGVGGTMLVNLSFLDSLQREKAAAMQSYRMAVSVMRIAALESSADAMVQVCADTMNQLQGAVAWTSASLLLDGEELWRSGTIFRAGLTTPEEGQCLTQIFTHQDRHCLQLTGGIQTENGRMLLTIVTDVSDVYQSREEMLGVFRWVFLVTLASGGMVSFLLAAALTRPLGRVSAATEKMAGGDLAVRLRVRANDEVGELARDFNHMADKLQENILAMEETMAAQERFMGSFAHELKTPITSIIGYADLLRSQSLDAREAQEAANYIFSEGKRLESLSLKLLQLHLARHETPELETVAVDKLVERLAKQMRPVYGKAGIRLECRTSPGLCSLDPALMESVLMNLMDNARKAIDSGGVIALTVDFPEGCCRIRVADNGRGMPEEALNHLTEAFYRVDKSRSRSQGGAGLGLSLCNAIVQYHHGELKFESKLGRGTCASIILKGVSR